MWNKLAVLQTIKLRITMWPSNSTPRYIPNRNEDMFTQKNCTWTFIAPLFMIAKWPNQLKCPPTDKQINKMCYNHPMEYYSIIKRNEVLIYTTTWMNLEVIMPSEKNSHKRANIVWLHLYEMSAIWKSLETESSGCLGLEGGGHEGGKLKLGGKWDNS